MMGNRGGRIHDNVQQLTSRRWASRRWIICLCKFKGRQRKVWGNSYTELFFLDEVTALAAGHRPCFECRRAAANNFAARFPAQGGADAIDAMLHRERLRNGDGDPPLADFANLPDGAMILHDGEMFALRNGRLLPWSFSGYGAPASNLPGKARLITPLSSCAALANGYRPLWHGSALRD